MADILENRKLVEKVTILLFSTLQQIIMAMAKAESVEQVSEGESSDSGSFQADWQAIAIPQEISLPHHKRKHSFICGCCVVNTCRNNFKDLPERIMKSEPYAVFELGHENISSEMVHTVPGTLKWHNFLFDLSNFRTQHFFNNKDFTCNIGVNGHGHSQVFAHWRVLDKY